jgi:HK97 gp10 family phage protein
MMNEGINIELMGDEELMRLLRSLPGKMSKKFVQDAWVKSAKPVKKAMKAALPEDTGTAKRAVTAIRGKSYKTPTVFVGPKKGRSKKSSGDAKQLKSAGASQRIVKQAISADAWYLKFLWRGTKYITPRKGMGGYEAAVNRTLPEALRNFKKELQQVIIRAMRKK